MNVRCKEFKNGCKKYILPTVLVTPAEPHYVSLTAIAKGGERVCFFLYCNIFIYISEYKYNY